MNHAHTKHVVSPCWTELIWKEGRPRENPSNVSISPKAWMRHLPHSDDLCVACSAIEYGNMENHLFRPRKRASCLLLVACVPRRPMNCQGSCCCCCCCSARDKVEKHYEGGLWEQKCTNNFCSLTPQMGGSYYMMFVLRGHWRPLEVIQHVKMGLSETPWRWTLGTKVH